MKKVVVREEKYMTRYSLPYFIIHFLRLEDLQGSNLVEDLRLVEAHQVVDDHVRGPDMLKSVYVTKKSATTQAQPQYQYYCAHHRTNQMNNDFYLV